MSNPFKQFVNQFHKYSRSDRNAILILSAFILAVVIANVIFKNIKQGPNFDSSEYEKIVNEWEEVISKDNNSKQYLFNFNPNIISESQLDSLDIPSLIKRNLLGYRNAGGKFNTASDLQKIYGMNDSIFILIEPYIEFEKEILRKSISKIEIKKKNYSGYFDPNKAGFDELKNFGFNNFQAKNLLNYRSKGGVFKNASDLLKIYGLDSLFFANIEKHIQIEKQVDLPIIEQKPEVYNVELNGADSVGLVKLKGIGPVYAARIIKYRELLGGYYSKNQLLEVYNFPEETFLNIEKYISADTVLIRKIRINFAGYKDLLRHPYLNKEQVKALLDYKEKNGAFENIAAIQWVNEIDSVTYLKMEPYFTCR